MADPTTENKVAAAVNQILKGIIEGAGQKVLIAMILADTADIVAIPVVGIVWTKLVEFAVEKFGSYFYTQAAHAATSIIIDVQTNVESSNVRFAFDNLTMAMASGDPNAIAQASTNLSDAYATLVHYDGSANP